MNRLTTIVMTLVLLAHSLAGCCSHHAHAAEAEATACCHTHHQQRHHDSTLPNSDSESPADGCSEASCVFLKADRSPSLDSSAALAFRYAVPQVEASKSAGQLACALLLAPDRVAPPMRLHLLHQILLI